MRIRRVALAAAVLPLSTMAVAVNYEPVIDMHVHADASDRSARLDTCPGTERPTYLAIDPAQSSETSQTERCAHPLRSVLNEDELRVRTIAELRRHHVVRAVLLGAPATLDRWRGAAPKLFIPATSPVSPAPDELARLEALVRSGSIGAIGELGAQYAGYAADDPKLDPIWALAERLDVPAGIHLGLGMPLTGAALSQDKYRASLTSPFQLETVLKKHPRLRLYVMHAASPLTDQMIAMLFTYPTLYVDISASDWNIPRAQFLAELKRLIDAGFEQRIMFGSDQTIFPQAIGLAIESIETVPFLSKAQKRAILYDNAARFLRLSPEEIAADHARH